MTLQARGRIDTIKHWRTVDELNNVINSSPEDALLSDALIVKAAASGLRYNGRVKDLPFDTTVAIKNGSKLTYITKLMDGTFRAVG